MSKHYDVGILGVWFGCNYGSIATYYVLNRIIQDMGKSVLMVHRPWINPFDTEEMESRHSMKFARAHYDISESYNVEDMYKLNDLCDTFVLGSDQLWKYGVTKIFGHSYFLDFADKDKKKIAYATSFGSNRFIAPSEYMWKAVKCFRRMNYVSVREEVNVNMCRKLFGIRVQHVLDPVLLGSSSYLGSIAEESERTKQENYIVAYILDPTPEKKEALLYMAQKENKDLVVMLDGWPYLFKRNANNMGLKEFTAENVTVTDWLFYIKHSDLVLTDSFHGTCMAILFEKPFFSFSNPGRGAERFVSLLSEFGLMDRYLENPLSIKEKQDIPDIDYEAVALVLSQKRKDSMAWLEHALNSKEKRHSIRIRSEVLFPLRDIKSIHEYEQKAEENKK